ncbi:MAG: hypothetical protein L6Q57_07810 [Alphaproteobacteria bacterium]|nr:hypothetical protein [Alphaproteobacteria bacterium]
MTVIEAPAHKALAKKMTVSFNSSVTPYTVSHVIGQTNEALSTEPVFSGLFSQRAHTVSVFDLDTKGRSTLSDPLKILDDFCKRSGLTLRRIKDSSDECPMYSAHVTTAKDIPDLTP